MEIGGQINLAEVVQALIATIGITLVIHQMRQLRTSIRGVTQDSLYAHYTEIGNWFLQNSHLRPYFYNNKKYEPDDNNANLRDEIDLMSEAILSLIEHAVLQKTNLPNDSWERCWRQYALDRLKNSDEMRQFFDDNREWYAAALCREVEDLIEEIKSGVRSQPGASGRGKVQTYYDHVTTVAGARLHIATVGVLSGLSWLWQRRRVAR